MADLQLFRVTVTETFTAEAQALVWALDWHDAEMAARKEVEIDHLDAKSDGTEESAHVEPIETAINLTQRTAGNYWLIMPKAGRQGQWDTVELDEFRTLLDPERMQRARLAAIERNNGQLALLEVAS